jgi:dolichol kinase
MLQVLPSRGWVIAACAPFAIVFWSLEIWRRSSPAVNERLMRFFSPISHAEERYRVNSSTWYATALVLLAVVAPVRVAAVGVVVLAAADPIAGFIGRRFGRIPLRAGRSLEGSLAFVIAGTLAALAWLVAFDALSMPRMLPLALGGAIGGALAEILSTRLDDNFTIPLAASLGAAAAQLVLPG